MRCLMATLLAAAFMLPARGEPAPAGINVLRVRPRVQVQRETVTLGDVLSFAEADPALRAALTDAPLDPDLHAPASTIVPFRQIEQRLRALGVNPARTLLRGAAACRVTLEPPVEVPAIPETAPAPRGAPAAGGTTLADILRQRIDADLAELGGTAEVDFERASAPFLDLTSDKWEFVIRSRGHARLGLREFRVVLRREGRTQRTVTLFARVRLSKPVVVAREPLNVGTFVRREQVGLERRLFERIEDIGLGDIAAVVGQRVRRFVPTGQMLRPGDLKPVDMVERSRPVTVIGAGRHVQVRLTGVALDSGSFGETVRVRLGQTRQNRRVVRGVVAGLATVRLEEEYP